MTFFNPRSLHSPAMQIGARYLIVDEHHTCCGQSVEARTQLLDSLVVCEVVTMCTDHMVSKAEREINLTHIGTQVVLHPNQVKIEKKNAKG